MQDAIGKLRARLRNWGNYLNHDADIGPKAARCISLESRYMAEAGDVFEDESDPPPPTPNVPDADIMAAHIRRLDLIQQYVLAVTYGGTPTVMRWRRVGDHQMKHALDMAELLLYESLKKTD